ncbi:hypothetical protein CAEBREN_06877 [Caenorhabditis brenneri]|uniref:Receptor ligand binding region domain-containing protein n=1 Tax=Caenorhabditis brenneri TaxID=135651 RepID=G0PK86_CAEBE|nr:hypothetical protein CAEBREN_06877 [Caenorhabditis brenneri]
MDVIWKVLLLFILFYEVDGQNQTFIPTYNGTANSTAGSRRTIKVGIAAAQQTQTGSIGWSVCGGAVPLAIEKLKQAGYAKNFDFEYIVDYTECDLGSVVRAGLKFIKELNVDVIIGPPCAQALRTMSLLASIYRKPVLGWGFVSESDLSDVERFPYLTTVLPNSQISKFCVFRLGFAAAKMLQQYRWGRIAMLYYQSDLDYCSKVMDDVEATFNDLDTPVNIVIKAEMYLNDNETTDIVLQSVKSRARIILWCSQTVQEKRDYLIKMSQHDMITIEYVHIMLSMRNIAFGVQTVLGKNLFTQSGLTPIWESFSEVTDGMEEIVKHAATRMLVLDVNSEVTDKSYLQYMQKNIIKAVRSPPMNCSTVDCLNANNTIMGAYARHLFDVVYLYGKALTMTNSTDPAVYDDVDVLVPQFITSFEGRGVGSFTGDRCGLNIDLRRISCMTGEVVISTNLTRMSIFQLYGLNAQYDQAAYINFTFINDKMVLTKLIPATSPSQSFRAFPYSTKTRRQQFGTFMDTLDRWILRFVDFLGNLAPFSFWEQYRILIVVAIILILLLMVLILVGCCCMIVVDEQSRR